MLHAPVGRGFTPQAVELIDRLADDRYRARTEVSVDRQRRGECRSGWRATIL